MMHKNEIKTKIALSLAIFLFLGFFAYLGGKIVIAEETDTAAIQLQNEKDQRQKKLAELNKQIKSFTEQIVATRKASNTLKNEVLIYDKQIASTELQIEAKQTQIEDTSLQIAETEKLIGQKNKEISENKLILSELVKQLNEYDRDFSLKATLGAGTLSEFFDQVQYTQSYQDKIFQLVQKIKDLKARLETQEKELQLQLKRLTELKDELEVTRESLSQDRSNKQKLLNQTRGLEQNFQKLLAVSKKEEQDIQKEIDDLDAQIRAKLGNRTIAAKKGVLAWPMDGILTQKYGNTGFTSLGYNFHNGIDIAAPAGQPIYAAGDGEVLYTDSSDEAFGNWVAIKHPIQTAAGNRTVVGLYAHLRTIKTSPGKKVVQGDLVGYEGNTGNTTKKLYGPERGYHIHFGIYDIEGFGVNKGKYGDYLVPYGYTYNPLDFL